MNQMYVVDQIKRNKSLAAFQVDPVRGFLPAQDPLEQLPAYYTPWEQMVANLPMLLTANRARVALKRLPVLAVNYLETDGQVERAMLLLSMFASAYVWEGETARRRIPHNIAQPLCAVAERLERPPILSYTSIVLHNWRRLDHVEALNAGLGGGQLNLLNLENLALQHSFWGGIDEQWFYLISVAIEAAGAPALPALLTAQLAVANHQISQLAESLQVMSATLTKIIAILLRLPEKCDPYIFYHRIRHFIGGWSSDGVIYEGVTQTPQSFVGSSAAQSPLLQAIDAGLDISHTDQKSAYLHKVRAYMERGHRRFICALEAGPSVRDYVMANRIYYPALCERYNACVRALEQFRKKHLEIAVQYITQQAPQQTQKAEMGTGGTPFVPFLSQVRKNTREHLIMKEAYHENG